MDTMLVRLFGQTEVLLEDGRVISDLGGAKPRQILEILAVSLGRPVSKERLADLLWDGCLPRTYQGTLESYVSLVRRRLGLLGGRSSALASTSRGYVLDPSRVRVDLQEVQELMGRPTTTGADRLPENGGFLPTPGDLLASEPDAAWAKRERDAFRTGYVEACRRAGEVALQSGAPARSADWARRAIACEPLGELCWQLLMRSLCASGATVDALGAYAELRQQTVNELGSEPGPASQQLYLEMLRADAHPSGAASTANEIRLLLKMLGDLLQGCPRVELAHEQRRVLRDAQRLVEAA